MCSFFKRTEKNNMEKMKFLTSLAVLILLLTYANATLSGPKAEKHFVLVHRASHEAWSWYKIVALMQSSGHNVTTIDLAASGHEFGGFAISKAMETFPEKNSVVVFVTALMPGRTLNATIIYTELLAFTDVLSALDNRVTYDNELTTPPTTLSYGPKYLATKFYNKSPIQDFVLATTVLRPIYIYSVEDVSKEIVMTNKSYGLVKRAFIVVVEEIFLKKKFQWLMIEKNPPDEVEEIQGSDHMMMISKPQQLFTTLRTIDNKYS